MGSAALLLLCFATLHVNGQFQWGRPNFGANELQRPFFKRPNNGWRPGSRNQDTFFPHNTGSSRNDNTENNVEDSINFPSGGGDSFGRQMRWPGAWPGPRDPSEGLPVQWPGQQMRAAQTTRRRLRSTTVRPSSGTASRTASCGRIVPNRIAFGKDAYPGQFPWQAGLVYTSGNQRKILCAGALISPSYVLTAAHCINRAGLRGWSLAAVRLGALEAFASVTEESARELQVAQELPHPNYTQDGVRGVRNAHDIALLRLAESAPTTTLIRTVCLPQAEERGNLAVDNTPKTFLVAGWGFTEEGELSSRLKFASVVPETAQDCGRRLDGVTIPDYQLCAIGKQKEDSCEGDSGGPLIAPISRSGDIAFEVEGIVSFGKKDCLQGNPGAYTRVASYVDWIEQTMKK